MNSIEIRKAMHSNLSQIKVYIYRAYVNFFHFSLFMHIFLNDVKDE